MDEEQECAPEPYPRVLTNVNEEQATQNKWKIVKSFDCEVVGKAVFEEGETKIMKSTKRFKVPGGWIYNTTTEQCERGRVSIAEAIAFVPENK